MRGIPYEWDAKGPDKLDCTGDCWAIGTGSPGQPREVVVYPLASDLRVTNTIVTYRHVNLGDE